MQQSIHKETEAKLAKQREPVVPESLIQWETLRVKSIGDPPVGNLMQIVDRSEHCVAAFAFGENCVQDKRFWIGYLAGRDWTITIEQLPHRVSEARISYSGMAGIIQSDWASSSALTAPPMVPKSHCAGSICGNEFRLPLWYDRRPMPRRICFGEPALPCAELRLPSSTYYLMRTFRCVGAIVRGQQPLGSLMWAHQPFLSNYSKEMLSRPDRFYSCIGVAIAMSAYLWRYRSPGGG